MERCVNSAMDHGADHVTAWHHDHFARTYFYKENEKICAQPRGLGYWIWKPYIILEAMKTLREGDYLIYLDAGVEVINNLKYIIDRMKQDIFLFGNLWDHAEWCKRDIVEEILPAPWEVFGKQVQASAIFLRVTSDVRAFIEEWLYWCRFEDGRLIDDSPSRTPNASGFADNRYDQAILSTLAVREGIEKHWWPATYKGGSVYPPFKENRHDQAVLTTMAYRDKIGLHHWPVKYCMGTSQEFDQPRGHYEDDYPVLFHHHRLRNHEWSVAA